MQVTHSTTLCALFLLSACRLLVSVKPADCELVNSLSSIGTRSNSE